MYFILMILLENKQPGGRLNIKLSSYQYRDPSSVITETGVAWRKLIRKTWLQRQGWCDVNSSELRDYWDRDGVT